MAETGYHPLPADLAELHDAAIQYAVDVGRRAAEKHEKLPQYPLAHGALFTLQWRATVVHRAVRVLCETGWTPVVPILIRTLLDIIASCYTIVAKPEDSEYMGFKYMGSYLIQSTKDPETAKELLQLNQGQLHKLQSQLRGNDIARADTLIKAYRPQTYWYRPEYESPGAILKTASTELHFIYRLFSSAVHGGFLGSALFDDAPDMADINPHEHPRRMRVAIVMCSRILLETSYMRDGFEGTNLSETYKKIMKELYMPQKDEVSPAPASSS